MIWNSNHKTKQKKKEGKLIEAPEKDNLCGANTFKSQCLIFNKIGFGVILVHVAWPRAQPLGQSVSLKFLLETRLESESFELLIDFLAFLGQKLWSKINKLINYLMS